MAITVGTILKHPTLGFLKVTRTEQTKVHGVTEDGQTRVLMRAFVEKACAEVAPETLDPESPLVAAKAPAPARGRGASASRARPCSHCGKPLNRSRLSADGRLKSCPNCSAAPGSTQHVFYRDPDDFGTSDARTSDSTPDGVQSYCRACRLGEQAAGGIMCDSVEQQVHTTRLLHI